MKESGGDNLHELLLGQRKDPFTILLTSQSLKTTSVVLEGLEACLEQSNLLRADFWLFSYGRSMKFLIGKKLDMSQLFKEDGTVVPVTYVQAGPCVVTDVRTKENVFTIA